MTRHQLVERKLDVIEAEMKNVGMWSEQPPASLEVTSAFGGETMAFEQWLQFVFVPRVRSIIAERGAFPGSSQVALQAQREWKQFGSEDRYDHLIERLREFDALFDGSR